MTNIKNQKGFTMIELMIATMVFSVVLVLLTSGAIYFTNMYYKGVNLSSAQNTARQITDSVSQAIQFSGKGTPIGPGAAVGNIKVLCVGSKRYTYTLDKQVAAVTAPVGDQVPHALVMDKRDVCNSASSPVPDFDKAQVAQSDASIPTSSLQELVGERMRLSQFSVEMQSEGFYKITVGVVYGDTDLLTSDHRSCANVKGSQYCGASTLVTTVQKRLN